MNRGLFPWRNSISHSVPDCDEDEDLLESNSLLLHLAPCLYISRQHDHCQKSCHLVLTQELLSQVICACACGAEEMMSMAQRKL